MNKEELEAFRYIVKELQRLITDREYYIFNIYPKLETLEQYFLKMDQLENINPSKALESLEKVKGYRTGGIISFEVFLEDTEEYNTLKQALLKLDFLEDAMDLSTNCFSTFKNRNGDEVTIMRRERYEEYQEQEKVLKILFEKEVNLGMLKTCKTVEQYNAGCRIFGRNELTQEEFELLKRYFG